MTSNSLLYGCKVNYEIETEQLSSNNMNAIRKPYLFFIWGKRSNYSHSALACVVEAWHLMVWHC